MLIEDKDIEIKINHRNRKYYEEIFNKELKNRDLITIKQKDVQNTARTLVECECDFCTSPFMKKIGEIVNKTFCSKECRNEHLKLNNPNPKKDEIKVECSVCKEPIYVNEAKSKSQEHFLCSRECYKKHRSLIYKGDKIYNYQDLIVECEHDDCIVKFKVSQFDIDSRNNLFCSPECYWNHRKDNYTDIYYSSDLNNSRKETKPERLVREWLDNNNISYIQEFGFMRKYYIDFYIPKYKSFIEVFGDYWHVNRDVFGEGDNLRPLTEQQKGKREDDLQRIQEIESHGYNVYVIWEKEVHENIDLYMGKIIENFK